MLARSCNNALALSVPVMEVQGVIQAKLPELRREFNLGSLFVFLCTKWCMMVHSGCGEVARLRHDGEAESVAETNKLPRAM